MVGDKGIEITPLGYLLYSVTPNASGTYIGRSCSSMDLYSNALKIGTPSSFGSSPGFTHPVSRVGSLAAYLALLGHINPLFFNFLLTTL